MDSGPSKKTDLWTQMNGLAGNVAVAGQVAVARVLYVGTKQSTVARVLYVGTKQSTKRYRPIY